MTAKDLIWEMIQSCVIIVNIVLFFVFFTRVHVHIKASKVIAEV